jgi:hypothetical protein
MGASQLDYGWGSDALRTLSRDQQVISPNEKDRGSEGFGSSFRWQGADSNHWPPGYELRFWSGDAEWIL